jgi:hypothetical protein
VRCLVSPGVPSTILDDDIALLEMNSLGVIQLQPNFTVENHRVVECIGFVYCRIFLLKMIR